MLHRGDGGPAVLEELVRRFEPLARSVARRYQSRGEPLDDLIQVANMGLLKAIPSSIPAAGSRSPATRRRRCSGSSSAISATAAGPCTFPAESRSAPSSWHGCPTSCPRGWAARRRCPSSRGRWGPPRSRPWRRSRPTTPATPRRWSRRRRRRVRGPQPPADAGRGGRAPRAGRVPERDRPGGGIAVGDRADDPLPALRPRHDAVADRQPDRQLADAGLEAAASCDREDPPRQRRPTTRLRWAHSPGLLRDLPPSTARCSWALSIFERPSTPICLASL